MVKNRRNSGMKPSTIYKMAIENYWALRLGTTTRECDTLCKSMDTLAMVMTNHAKSRGEERTITPADAAEMLHAIGSLLAGKEE